MLEFFKNYSNQLRFLLDNIDINVLMDIKAALEKTIKDKSRIYVIGNGGSASTASHMANDLGIGLKRKSIINFDIISLCDNIAVNTAIANDLGYENVFYAQLKDIMKPKDLLIAISCSGNSPNIIKASEYAKSINATLISLTGFDGGKLKKISDINFHIQTQVGEYGLVEDMHIIFNHILYSYYCSLK